MDDRLNNSFWFKWELQNEGLEMIRDRILEGNELGSKEVARVIESFNTSSIKGNSSTNQLPYASFSEYCWSLGSYILLNHGNVNQLTDFLLQMSGIQQHLQEDCLVELTLVSIKSNQLKEALERLETYIPLLPYGENSKLVGYAGLIAYVMWKRDTAMIRYRRTAVEFLQNSIRLNVHDCSYFLKYLVLLMSSNENDQQELIYFLEGVAATSTDYYILAALYKLYREHILSPSTWIPLAYKLCVMNPTIDHDILLDMAYSVFSANIPAVESRGIDCQAVMELLASRIEYDKTNIFVWKCMIDHMHLLS